MPNWITPWISGPQLWIVLAAALRLMLFFSWRVDVNVFSFHMFYRNRLARCYLGASNRDAQGASVHRFRRHRFAAAHGDDASAVSSDQHRE
jgi:hypothetical protein